MERQPAPLNTPCFHREVDFQVLGVGEVHWGKSLLTSQRPACFFCFTEFQEKTVEQWLASNFLYVDNQFIL
jgi:hypothetical protein